LASARSEFYKALLAALILARKADGVAQVALTARIRLERRLDVAEYIVIARAIGGATCDDARCRAKTARTLRSPVSSSAIA
jgi:hypothetical protein